MKKVNIGTSNYSIVHALDELDDGGAYHEYCISRTPKTEEENSVPLGEFGFVQFQKGPVKENGVNGCHQEDLLAIVIHRLQCFQKGDFACRENAIALTKLEEAMHWLRHRTNDRVERGVEDTLVK